MYLSDVWQWIIFGLVLIVSELIIPGFWIIFFGFSALCIAAIKWLMPEFAAPYSITFFAILGLCLLIISRRCFPQFFANKGNADTSEKHVDTDDIEGNQVVVTVPIAPNRPGKVDFRGSTWSAKSDKNIPAGEIVTIVSRSNLTLIVK